MNTHHVYIRSQGLSSVGWHIEFRLVGRGFRVVVNAPWT